MNPKTEQQIPRLVQLACVLEACSPKPGNVNRYHDFGDTSLEDYLLSAAALGSALENAAQAGVGEIILDAAMNTHHWVRSNTNLGMILLFAPLVKAALHSARAGEDIRRCLMSVLNALTVEDARLAYAAVRLMQPGGLGQVPQADISGEPTITLLQAMALAQERDAIAREYGTGFAITFGIGLPALKNARSHGESFSDAIVQTFLAILSEVPDTLIARKKGMKSAQQVSQLAADVLAKGGVFTAEGQAGLAEMDNQLRDKTHTLNPGTTADLTAAATLLALLETLP
jgi:triphosphoribosyl-dephospho-CoA synthase